MKDNIKTILGKSKIVIFGITVVLCFIANQKMMEAVVNSQYIWEDNFESGSIDNWILYGQNCKLSVSTDSADGKYALGAKFDDSSKSEWFSKGMIISFNPSIELNEKFQVISCEYKVDTPIVSIGYLMIEKDGDVWKYTQKVGDRLIGEYQKFCADIIDFRYGWNELNIETAKKLDTSIKQIYISVRNKEKPNLGKSYNLDIDNFWIGKAEIVKKKEKVIPKPSLEKGLTEDKDLWRVSSIDSNGNFIINGEYFFPIGIYTVIGIDEASAQYLKYDGKFSKEVVMKWLKDIKSAGFNVFQTYAMQFYGKTTFEDKANTENLETLVEGTVKLLDYADEVGLKVLSPVQYFKSSILVKGGVDWALQKRHIEALVKAVRYHPALFGYYLADEPENGKVLFDDLKLRYDFVKTLDKVHPEVVVYCFESEVGVYNTCADVVAPDPYPIQNNQPLRRVTTFLDLLKDSQIGGMPAMMFVTEMFSHKNKPLPTLEQMRVETFLALTRDVKGLLFFMHSFPLSSYPYSESNPKHWSNVSNIVHSVRNILPAIFSSDIVTDYSVSDRRVESIMKRTYKENQTCLYLIAVNPLEETDREGIDLGKVTFSNIPATEDSVVTVLDEDSQGKLKLGSRRKIELIKTGPSTYSFTDTFGKLSTHVYKIGSGLTKP